MESQAQRQSNEKKEFLVDFDLVRNSKAMRSKGFVARIKENGEIEFLRAAIPQFSKGGALVSGEYKVRAGDVLIVKYDDSSHKNAIINYTLVKVEENGSVNDVAQISFVNGYVEFSDDDLRVIYANVSKNEGKSKPITALVNYAKEKKLI